jgi:hypothetical protein
MDGPQEDKTEPIRRNDPQTWCDCCQEGRHEDLLHLLWECQESIVIWDWIYIVMTEVGGRGTRFSATPAQALLGAKIHDAGRLFPEKLWEILRGHGIWEIWIARDKLVMDDTIVTREEVISKT